MYCALEREVWRHYDDLNWILVGDVMTSRCSTSSCKHAYCPLQGGLTSLRRYKLDFSWWRYDVMMYVITLAHMCSSAVDGGMTSPRWFQFVTLWRHDANMHIAIYIEVWRHRDDLYLLIISDVMTSWNVPHRANIGIQPTTWKCDVTATIQTIQSRLRNDVMMTVHNYAQFR